MIVGDNTKNSEINGTIRYIGKLFAVYFVFITICLLTLYGLSLLSLHDRVFGFVVFIVLGVFPIFYRPFKSFHTKCIRVQFYENDFHIDILNIKTDTLEKQLVHRYSDIKSCSLESKRDKYSKITLIFYNGKTEKYIFIDEQDDVNTSEAMYHQLVSFSKHSADENKIVLAPSEYASKPVFWILRTLLVVMIIFMVYQFFFALKTLPYSIFFTLFLLIRIFYKRKEDIEHFKKNNS